MSHVLPWPPMASTPPPQQQYQEGVWQGWRCICSHLEASPDGPVPHFVVDWTQQPEPGKPYPFLPSAVPGFLQDVWLANSKKNRPKVKNSIAELQDRHWGLPVFVVGTGPSLLKNMDVLRDNKDGIIIATNNALNILPQDVKIDYYCAVDGRLPKRWWVESKRKKDFKVVSVPLVTPLLTECFDPDNIYWARFAGSEGPNACFADYGDLEQCCLEPGYVVGFTATHLAFWLGGNPIVFVGMDCSMQNGYLHANDSAKAHWLPQEEYIVAKDIYGTPQVTSATYLRGCWKLSASAKLNGVHRRFINATEGGILQEFMDKVPLREVVSWQK